MTLVHAVPERNIRNVAERMYNLLHTGNNTTSTKEDIPILYLTGKELSSPFYGTWIQVPRLSHVLFYVIKNIKRSFP